MTEHRDRYLLEPKELLSRLNQPNLQIFDASVSLQVTDNGYRAISGREAFEEHHLPGAGFLDLIQDLSDTSTGLGFTLPEHEDLAARIAAQGVSSEADVVIYSSGHMMWATRAFWMLRSLGHDRVQVLNGGLAAWQAINGPMESGSAAPTAADFHGTPRSNLFVRLPEMQALVEAGSINTACTLDAGVYEGSGDFHYGRRGHIPGSGHLYYEDLLNDGAFLPHTQLRDVVNAAGYGGNERLVTYCGGGIAATLLAFARLTLGLDNTGVYDGSLSEWVAAQLPLVEGTDPG